MTHRDAESCEQKVVVHCAGAIKVFAKTGTVALPDPVNGRLIQAESLGGYLEAEPGRFDVFYLVVNGAAVQDIDGALQVFDDLADISAILQQDTSQQVETSRGYEQSSYDRTNSSLDLRCLMSSVWQGTSTYKRE